MALFLAHKDVYEPDFFWLNIALQVRVCVCVCVSLSLSLCTYITSLDLTPYINTAHSQVVFISLMSHKYLTAPANISPDGGNKKKGR